MRSGLLLYNTASHAYCVTGIFQQRTYPSENPAYRLIPSGENDSESALGLFGALVSASTTYSVAASKSYYCNLRSTMTAFLFRSKIFTPESVATANHSLFGAKHRSFTTSPAESA